ncbi:MAG: amidohydrolase [Thermodesulfatator sp.]|nr:MAG: amidohydrolase [Thermodesulfatator sp.]
MQEYPLGPKPVLLRAPVILPMVSPPLIDGAVVVSGGRVRELGSFRHLRRTFRGKILDLGEVALLPALVNAHTHLELSVFRFRLTPSGSFVSWVRSLLRKRTEVALSEARRAVKEALQELWQEGVGLIADIGNTGLSLGLLREAPFYSVYFREIIDFKGDSRIQEFVRGPEGGRITYSLSPHAPYTVSPVLIQALKSWTRRAKLPLSIHVAESPEECAFLERGQGPLRTLLEERGQLPSGFEAPGLSPVAYLQRLGVLDERTICVHLVQVSRRDLEILARHQARPCLCPRSNIFLGVGLAPLPQMLSSGLKPCLGTDSLASNDRLSVLAEVEALYAAYPEVPPEKFFLMATLWGAEALGRRDLGFIGPGARAELIGLGLPPGRSSPWERLLEGPKKVEVRLYATV